LLQIVAVKLTERDAIAATSFGTHAYPSYSSLYIASGQLPTAGRDIDRPMMMTQEGGNNHAVGLHDKKAVLSQRWPRGALLLCDTDTISVWSSNTGTIQP